MASKRPLVHYSGTLRELVDNDTLDVRGFLDVVAAATTARVYSTAGDSTLRVLRPAGSTGRLDFCTGASTRWSLQVDNSAEGGSNAGSNLVLYRYTDAGAGSAVLSVSRATGAVTVLAPLSSTGDVDIAKAAPKLTLAKSATGQAASIFGKNGTANRWEIQLGDVSAESGSPSNVGSHLRIYRYNDAGSVIADPGGALAIGRHNGIVYIVNGISVATGSVEVVAGNVSAVNGNFSGNVTANGTTASTGYYWNGGSNGLVAQAGTWATDGTTRWNIVWNAGPGNGDTSYGGHWHQPGVISFFQVNQAGVYMRYTNSGRLSVQTAYDVYSDRRIKHDIQDLTDVRARVESMPVKTFRKNAEAVGLAGPQIAPLNIGVIAQDAEVRNPEIVRRQLDLDNPDDPDPLRTVDAAGAGYVALAGVQDLYARLDAALLRIQDLERELHPSGTA